MAVRRPAPFRAHTERVGADVVVDITGDLDVHTAPRLLATVEAALLVDPDAERVVLELADCGFVDSSGLGVMLATQRLAEGTGATFGVRHPSDRLRSTLRMTGLDRVLSTVP